MGPLGVQEMVVIFLVALVLFGPKKLPELGKTIAKAVSEFRRAQSDLKATFDREMQSLERENESLKEVTRTAAAELSSFSDDLSASANGTYGAGILDSPQTPTVSASAVPGAESPAAADTAAHVASLLDTPSAAALEPGVDFGQPVEAAAAHEAARAAAIDAAIDAAIAEAQGYDAIRESAGAPAGTLSETAVAADPSVHPSKAPEAAQHS
jgi:sec-independent protein translocase protein TatA